MSFPPQGNKADVSGLATSTALTTHDTDIKADVGDFSGQTNLQSLLAVLGIPDVAAKPLYTCLVTDRLDHGTYGLSALQTLLAAIPTTAMRGTDNAALASSWTAALATALGNYTAVRAGYLDELAAANLPTDIAAIQTDLGDFSSQTNLQTLLAALGIPDVAAKPLYTCLVTDRLDHGTYGLSALQTLLAAIPTTAMRGTDNAALASSWTAALATALANYTAARAGYLDELAAANMPADLDTVKGLVDTAESAISYSYLDAGGEQDVYEDTAVTRREISVELDITNMTNGGIIRVYRKVDGSNYKIWIKENVDSVASGGDEDVYTVTGARTNQAFKITYEEDADEGAARTITGNVITQVLE